MAHALGIDVGTTNVKVALVADDGTIVARAAAPIETTRDGEIAEQDPEQVWSAVVDAVQAATTVAPTAARDVASVGVCSQYSSIVPVDERGTPVAGLVTYLDKRGTDHSLAIFERHPDAFEVWIERHGIPPVGGGLSLAHLLHFQHDRPDVHAATSAYLEVMDFVNRRLVGHVTATQCTMFAAQLCDNRVHGVTEYDAELVERAEVEVERLPGLVAPDVAVGEVAADVAELLGIPAGAIVQAALNDSHAGAFATDAYREGRAGLIIGTTAVVLDTVDRLAIDLDHEVLSMPSPVAGQYLVWAENGLAGKTLEHVLEQFVYTTDELADHRADDQYRTLEAALRASSPGAGGVLFLPWLAGSFSPQVDLNMRAAFLNLGLDTRRVDLVRAVAEGVAHNARWLLPIVEDFAGSHVDEVVFAGGAARSPSWAQIVADVLDRPVLTLADPDHAAARAVGWVALERAGASGSAPGTVPALPTPTTARYEPIAEHRARYEPEHEQFEAAFAALRPIYAALNG